MAKQKILFKERVVRWFQTAGFPIAEPVIRLIAGENPKKQMRDIAQFIGIPILTFIAFLGIWTLVARNIKTNYGTVPTPVETWTQAKQLTSNYFKEQDRKKAYNADKKKRADRFSKKADSITVAATKATGDRKVQLEKQAGIYNERAEWSLAQKYTGARTYLDQILTSLKTVLAGFAIASLIAIPVGILCGLSKTAMAALNPLIQIFKPVSPLAWLPIVMIIVGALHPASLDSWAPKAFVSSAVTVALCSLWPTLVNTALGVASIDKDFMNVAKMLKLNQFQRLFKIVLPASLPLMFTGLRISLGVGWMVLIAAEMLAQNPGLGKFVWDMFQNGSSQTLAQILVAVFTIGIVGFMLDRIMIIMQKLVSFDSAVSA